MRKPINTLTRAGGKKLHSKLQMIFTKLHGVTTQKIVCVPPQTSLFRNRVLCGSMDKKGNTSCTSRKIRCNLWNPWFITLSTRASQQFLFWTKWIQSTPFYSIYIWSILILASNLCIDCQVLSFFRFPNPSLEIAVPAEQSTLRYLKSWGDECTPVHELHVFRNSLRVWLHN
jgi:hypothetical protein